MRIHRNAIQPTNRPIRMQRRHRDKKRQKNDRTSSMDGALTVVSFLCSFFSLKLILINTQMWISVSFLMVSHSGYSEWILCLYGRAVESENGCSHWEIRCLVFECCLFCQCSYALRIQARIPWFFHLFFSRMYPHNTRHRMCDDFKISIFLLFCWGLQSETKIHALMLVLIKRKNNVYCLYSTTVPLWLYFSLDTFSSHCSIVVVATKAKMNV